jgi:predicted flap endonuclease-1-like 5' DNA nuclease
MEVEPGPPERTPDDLTIIEGIGPKIAAILQSAGIRTFDQLAATDVSRIREILDQDGLRLADPGSWGEQARLAAAGDQAGLKALQDRLNAGRQV